MLVDVVRHPLGPRVYLANRRFRSHHYHAGAFLIGVGMGLVLVDLADLLGNGST